MADARQPRCPVALIRRSFKVNAEPNHGAAKLPPLPDELRGRWLVGMLPEVLRDRLGFRLRLLEEYGDVVRYRYLGPHHSVALNHPNHVEHVLVTNYANYRKAEVPDGFVERLLGNGLITSEGDDWKQQRQVAQPAFCHARVEEMASVMSTTAAKTAHDWIRNEVNCIDLEAELKQVTLNVAWKALFGRDLHHEARAITATVTALLDRGVIPSPPRVAYALARRTLPFLPQWRNRSFTRDYERVVRLVNDTVQERRRSAAERQDLLSRLLVASSASNGHEDTGWLRDMMINFLVAAFETTSIALTWTWYLLSQHPEVERRVHQEVDKVLGDKDAPSTEDLARLKYTDRVLSESMRLFPPLPILSSRVAIEDDVFDDVRIIAGMRVVISPYAIHRHPRYWPDPERFDPDRFRHDRQTTRPRFSYLPFGAGPRGCIGEHFARTESLIVLATIARRFRLRLLPGHAVTKKALSILRPQGGLPVRLEPRF